MAFTRRAASCQRSSLGIALGAHALHDRLLLPHRFGQPREERLVVAQLSDADAAAGTLRVLLLVLAAVTRQFLQLRLRFGHAALARSQTLRETLLGVLDDVLDRLEAFGAGHGRFVMQVT